jgi:hypothetical protein
VGQLLDGEQFVVMPQEDGSFVVDRPPLLSPAEKRRWLMLTEIESQARSQAEENARRRPGG